MMKRLMPALITLLLTLPSTAALAEEPAHHERAQRPADDHLLERFGHAMRRLDLDQDQESGIQAILWDARERLAGNRQASRDTLAYLRELVTSESLDEDAMEDTATRMGELARERVLVTGRAIHAALAQLDPSQRAELQALHAGHRERRQARRPRDD